jgi:hypothetical protein
VTDARIQCVPAPAYLRLPAARRSISALAEALASPREDDEAE